MYKTKLGIIISAYMQHSRDCEVTMFWDQPLQDVLTVKNGIIVVQEAPKCTCGLDDAVKWLMEKCSG